MDLILILTPLFVVCIAATSNLCGDWLYERGDVML